MSTEQGLSKTPSAKPNAKRVEQGADAVVCEALEFLVSIHSCDSWYEGTAGNANVVSYCGDDVSPVAVASSDAKRQYIAACSPHRMRRLLAVLSRPAGRGPLTDERIQHFWDIHVGYVSTATSRPLAGADLVNFVRAIEAAHGIRGGGGDRNDT